MAKFAVDEGLIVPLTFCNFFDRVEATSDGDSRKLSDWGMR